MLGKGYYIFGLGWSTKDWNCRSGFSSMSSYVLDRLPGGKISWYFSWSYGLTKGVADLKVFEKTLLISSTFGSFWDVAAEKKPTFWEGTIWAAWHVSKLTTSQEAFCSQSEILASVQTPIKVGTLSLTAN